MTSPDDYRRESRARWGAQAAGWHARRDALRRATMPVSAWMVDAIDPQPGQALLELGAGTGDTGYLAAELIQPGGTLITSDFAPEMLTAAQRRAEELGIANVRFKQIDAESIDLDAASLDGVLSRWTYMLVADPEAAMRETRRVLKPGGRVALAAWMGPDDNPWTSLVPRTLAAQGLLEPPPLGVPGQFAWAREGIIAEHLEGTGFGEYRVEPLEFAVEFAAFDDWWQSHVELSTPFADAVAVAEPAALADAKAAVASEAERFTGADGTLVFPAWTWVAWASA